MATSKFLILLSILSVAQSITNWQSGDPLYLTDYIEEGQYSLAKRLALVDRADMYGVKSYAGFFSVNKEYNSNMFFWLFPAKNNSATAPLVLWLHGGPGMSGFYGLFVENGPFYIDSKRKLKLRQYSWHNDHNLLYIDNPVGSGFSFTDNAAGYATNPDDVATNLLVAIQQFLQIFSEYRRNAFYVTGSSYAGKYVPALCHAIFLNNKGADPKNRINLQGLAIGNGIVDPIRQQGIGEILYQLSFIDINDLQTFNAVDARSIAYMEHGDYMSALLTTSTIINAPGCLFNNLTGFTSPQNYLTPNGYDSEIIAVNDFMAKSNIGEALHVGNKTFLAFSNGNLAFLYLLPDVMQSVAGLLPDLINNYKVFFYNGQLDLLAGPTTAQKYLSYLQFNGSDQYKVAKRSIWRVNNEIAGYVKKAGNLNEITVRLAGHLVPYDQPKWTLDMLLRLTSGRGYSTFVKSFIVPSKLTFDQLN